MAENSGLFVGWRWWCRWGRWRIRSRAWSAASATTGAVLERIIELGFLIVVEKRAHLIDVTPVQGTQRLADVWLHTGSRAIGCATIRAATGPQLGSVILETF